MIYQLLHTSPKLSGQVRWDLVLDGSTPSQLHIVPLSDNVVYTHDNDSTTLDHRHGDNVRRLYKHTSDTFWKPVCEARLDGTQIVRSEDMYRDTHVNDYEMGMKRMKSYQQYGKQFCFLCPVWCDEPGELLNLSFRMTLKNGDNIISIRNVNFSNNKKLEKYIGALTADIASAGLKGNELVHVDYHNTSASLYGLNAESGQQMVCEDSQVVHNLINRERPVMEFDSMLCEMMCNHKLISNQLYNFNLCFNIADLLVSGHVSNTYYETLTVAVEVMHYDTSERKGVPVELRDLYTNYKSIPRYDCYTGSYKPENNVLDYLMDYRCIDLQHNNTVQPIFHWSLRENPAVSFNLYDGYAPTYKDVQLGSVNADFPDLFSDRFLDANANFNFCKYHNIDGKVNLSNWVITMSSLLSDESNFYTISNKYLEKDNFWFGNLFVDSASLKKLMPDNGTWICYDEGNENVMSGSIGSAAVEIKYMYAVVNIGSLKIKDVINTQAQFVPVANTGVSPVMGYIIDNQYQCTRNGDIYPYQTVKVVFIISDETVTKVDGELDERSFFTFYDMKLVSQQKYKGYMTAFSCMFCNVPGARETLYKIANGETYTTVITTNHDYVIIRLLANICSSVILPEVIKTGGTLDIVAAPRPEDALETKYMTNDHTVKLIRYGGDIMPLLLAADDIRKNDIYWTKQYVNTIGSKQDVDSINEYAKLYTTGFLPQYPSIGYVPYNITTIDYDAFYMSDAYGYIGDKPWFNRSVMRPLEESVSITAVSFIDSLDSDTLLYEHMHALNPEVTRELFDYFIKDKYNTSFTYDYADNKTTDTFLFNINYTLK